MCGSARVSDPDFIRVGDLLAQAIETFPLLEIELHNEVSGAAFEKVRDGALDASFYYGSLSHPTVASLPLRDFAYRVAAPAAWSDRVEDASWDEIVAMPWIMTPPISTHNALAGELFHRHGSSPAHRVEADHEAVISSLVVAGLGVSLMREDLALAAAAAGEIVLVGRHSSPDHIEFHLPGRTRGRSRRARAARRPAAVSGRFPSNSGRPDVRGVREPQSHRLGLI